MILTLSLAMMIWQGSCAQPQLVPTSPPNSVTNNRENSQHVADSQAVNLDKNSDKLDGRYGVDRVAMEKQAKEATGILSGSTTSSAITFMTSDYEIEPTMTCPKEYDLVPGRSFDVRDTVWKCRKNANWISAETKLMKPVPHGTYAASKDYDKPSPQIAAVRAVAQYKPHHVPCSTFVQGKGASIKGDITCSDGQDIVGYACPDKSAILLHSEDGSEHWCLKIEEPK